MGQLSYRSSSKNPIRSGRSCHEPSRRDARVSRSYAPGIPIFLQRSTRPAGFRPVVQTKLQVNSPGDIFEAQADRAAAQVANPVQTQDTGSSRSPRSVAAWSPPSVVARNLGSLGHPLEPSTRGLMEGRFGADFSDVRIHTGTDSARLNRDLGSRAFTQGRDIFFGEGHTPADDSLTAHELAHVVQQSGGRETQSGVGPLSARASGPSIQRSLTGSFPVTNGGFEIDMQTREGAVNTPPTHSGLDGYIRFIPSLDAPNSNSIVMVQIVKLTDLGGADVAPASLPAAQAPRGALGTPGLLTEDDPSRGVEGGFFTDVHHQPNASGPATPPGTPLSPRYNFQPAAPGTTGVVGQTQQTEAYGGGIGGVVGQTPGFKRSSDPADIRSAAMYDTPGVADPSWNLDFSFETAAQGEDTMITYGAVKWGFGLRAGLVVNETIDVVDFTSPTFDEALERHRDFYVHEPVTFYFDFADDRLSSIEASKIDTFLAYLGRNPGVQLSLTGFADIIGGPSVSNAKLSLRRAQAVEAALLARGVAASRIDSIIVGLGASTSATTDAGTGDQGGDPAVGADQTREANRFANRRVVLTFTDPAATPAPAPAGP